MTKYLWSIILVTLSFKAIAADVRTHCAADEEVFFSCPIAQTQKVISLCGGSTEGKEVSWVQYRFGRIGNPEMIFPENMDGSLEKFTGISQTAKMIGLEIREVWFSVGRYSYLIEHISGGDRDPSDPPENNDLIVFRNGRDVVAKFSCTNSVVNRLWKLDGHISDDATGRPG